MFKLNGWTKIVLPLVVAAVAFGFLQSQVARNKETLSEKASRETVNVQYEAINDKLDDIIARLGRLEIGGG